MKTRFNEHGKEDRSGEFYEGCQVVGVLWGSFIDVYGVVKVDKEGVPFVSSSYGDFIFQLIDDLMINE